MIAAAALSLAAATASGAQTTLTLDVDQMRQLAADTIAAGEVAQARALAEALLMRDPDDLTALTILAQTAFQMGDMATAREAAARIYRTAADPRRRYEAARLAALAAANEDRFSLGELWLRRALTVAPTEADVAQTTQDAAGLRRLNPWSASVRLSFAPSTNVNGGAESEINVIDGVPIVGLLSASAQALSGWVGQGDLSLSYRLRESQTSRSQVSVRAQGRGVILSEEAQQALDDDLLDDTQAEDFATRRLEATLSHDQVAERGNFGLDAAVGAYWSGTAFDYSYLRLSYDRTVSIDSAQALRGSVFGEQRFEPETNDPEDRVWGLQGQYLAALANGGQASAALAWSARRSDNLNDAYESWTLQFGYAYGPQVGPARLSGSVGVQYTDYPDYFVGFIQVPDGRQDIRWFAGLEAVFPDYSYAGFAPLVRLNAARTDSNVSRFELDEFNIEFGLRSTF